MKKNIRIMVAALIKGCRRFGAIVIISEEEHSCPKHKN